ncbi:hypothetical protein ACTMSW_01830 [Micromonospora sp. BQ11]|uniref:hypothetical protein n=1 Tax=Micromonospora sp. BQ11 TaxID=3452212 RepID=UPI003F88CC52
MTGNSPEGPEDPWWRTSPILATLVMLAWYGVLIGAFLAVVRLVDDTVAEDCTGSCHSDQGQVVLFGLFLGVPAMTVAFLISGLMLVLTTARSPRPRAVSAGTAAATPAIVAAVLVLCVGAEYLN